MPRLEISPYLNLYVAFCRGYFLRSSQAALALCC